MPCENIQRVSEWGCFPALQPLKVIRTRIQFKYVTVLAAFSHKQMSNFSIPRCRRFGEMWRVGGNTGISHSIAGPWVSISSPLAHVVYFLPFCSYLAGSKSVSARPSIHPSAHPPVQPGYDSTYCSRSYRFSERQNCHICW